MNSFDPQLHAVERRGPVSVYDPRGTVVCPKPRRIGILAGISIRPPRWHPSHQTEICDAKAGAELLDLILKKEGNEGELFGSSPPFYSGSPPSRAANPLIQDARFGEVEIAPISQLSVPSPSGLSSPSAAARKGTCARMQFGLKPAAVRVEGFDCLNRDRQNSSVPAVA